MTARKGKSKNPNFAQGIGNGLFKSFTEDLPDITDGIADFSEAIPEIPAIEEVALEEVKTAPEKPSEKQKKTKPKKVQAGQQSALESPTEPKKADNVLSIEGLGLDKKKETRKHRISLFVTERTYQRLQAVKKETGTPVNEILNKLIETFLDSVEGD